MKHTLPALPYAYEALEPVIGVQTMTIHHTKHHQAYVDNLNAALDKHPELYDKPLIELLKKLDQLPTDIKTAVQNNGGGHYNHSLFWTLLNKNGAKAPQPKVAEAITKAFGTFESFKETFSTAAKTRFGSGWAWLIVLPNQTLKVVSTPNQDTPLLEGKPILALDVWEHAYYLNYQNKRPDYINAFFTLVDWAVVEKLFLQN
jgi:superoxide dismutase, Fe-Mn family